MISSRTIKSLVSSSSRVLSTLSARTLHNSHVRQISSHIDPYPYFLEKVRLVQAFRPHVATTQVPELQTMLSTSPRLNEIVSVNPSDIYGATELFHKLGRRHLNEIITSVDDLIDLPQTVISLLDTSTLEKIFNTSESLVRGIIWAASSHYSIFEHIIEGKPTMTPSYFLNEMLNKLGKDYVTKLVSNPRSLVAILRNGSIAQNNKIGDVFQSYLELDQQQQVQENDCTSRTSFKKR